MKPFGLDKRNKLCSRTAIEELFASGGSHNACLAWPLRAVWRETKAGSTDSEAAETNAKILISVPKRRLRHAVDRVRIRRLTREAYRLARPDFSNRLGDRRLEIAFIYVGDRVADYSRVSQSMGRILEEIVTKSCGSAE